MVLKKDSLSSQCCFLSSETPSVQFLLAKKASYVIHVEKATKIYVEPDGTILKFLLICERTPTNVE